MYLILLQIINNIETTTNIISFVKGILKLVLYAPILQKNLKTGKTLNDLQNSVL